MYKISLHKRAKRQIKKIDIRRKNDIIDAIERLQKDPYKLKLVKLHKTPLTFRVRIGNYRITFIIIEKTKRINVRQIRHRQWDYKKIWTLLNF